MFHVSAPAGRAIQLAAIYLLAVADASAANLTVNPGGSIQAAVDVAQAGDQITVMAGVYRENINIPGGKDGLLLVGQGKVVIDARPAGLAGDGAGAGIEVASQNVTIQGLTVRHAATDSVSLEPGAGILCSAAGLTVKNCVLFHNGGSGVSSVGPVTITACEFLYNRLALDITGDGAVIKKCRIHDDGKGGMRVTGNGALIQANDLLRIDDGIGIEIIGSDAMVKKNTIDNTCGSQIHITGERAQVIDNDLRRGNGAGVEVCGDDAVVSGNQIDRCDGGDGIDVEGGDADILNNVVTFAADDGIDVNGKDAEVEDNTISRCGDRGVSIVGNEGKVQRNTISDSGDSGIRVTGDDAEVDDNTVSGTDVNGIEVKGDLPKIRNNQVSDTMDDAEGIVVISVLTSGTIEDNRLDGVIGAGVRVAVDCVGLSIRNNRVEDSCAEQEPAFAIDGLGHLVEANTALNCGGDGFNILGSNHQFRGNTAKNCALDGFDVDAALADGNLLDANQATGSAGEGIENNGTNTTVTNNTMKKNRTDMANDGTLLAFSGNTIGDDSDDTTPPDIDN